MAYIGNSPGVASQRIVSKFTATASQTTFTPTSGYTVGYLDVYLNGVKLINGEDYTASNGSTFVLASVQLLATLSSQSHICRADCLMVTREQKLMPGIWTSTKTRCQANPATAAST